MLDCVNGVDILIIIILLITVLIFIYYRLQNYIDLKIEGNKDVIDVLKNDMREKFTVHDANYVNDYDKIKEDAKEQPDNFIEDRMKVPSENNIVDYDGVDKDFYIGMTYGGKPRRYFKPPKKSCIDHRDFGYDPQFQTVSCANSSINNKYKFGKKPLRPSSTSCTQPNLLTAENYYKTHFDPRSIPVEDYSIRGWNYESYSNAPHPTKSNFRILSYNTKGLPPGETKYKNIPTGYNYAFHNTPAMRLP